MIEPVRKRGRRAGPARHGKHRPPIVLGLTGSIGMGKSSAAQALRRLGLPVHDSDAVVHRLITRGGAAVALVEAAFPGVTHVGAVDRGKLGARVFGDSAALRKLEAILHPLVRRSARGFLTQVARRRKPVAVLDIPLLFETGGESMCHAVMVVSAPARIQRARVLARPDMTEDRFDAILAQQMPDAEKRRRADYVIETGLSRRDTLRQIKSALADLRRRAGSRQGLKED